MSPTTSQTAALDYDKALSLVADPVVLIDILNLLDESLTLDLAKLRLDASSKSWSEMAKILHRIKGVLPMFCDAQTTWQLLTLEKKMDQLGAGHPVGTQELSEAQVQVLLDAFFQRLDQFHACLKSRLILNA
jgi:hypothetical protein